MAKKSFKKGVDSLIQSTANQEDKKQSKPKESSEKAKPPKSEKQIQENMIIDLGSRLTIDKVDEFKGMIMDAYDKGGNVVLKSNQVDDIDLAFIQMIKAMERSFKDGKKEFKMDIKVSDSAAELLKHSGFENFFNA